MKKLTDPKMVHRGNCLIGTHCHFTFLAEFNSIGEAMEYFINNHAGKNDFDANIKFEKSGTNFYYRTATEVYRICGSYARSWGVLPDKEWYLHHKCSKEFVITKCKYVNMSRKT